MELRDFKKNISNNVNNTYIEKYLEMIVKSNMQNYSDKNSFIGWFKRDDALSGTGTPSSEEIERELKYIVSNEIEDKDMVDSEVSKLMNSFGNVKICSSGEFREDDKDYVHKLIIKTSPIDCLKVAVSIYKIFDKRDLKNAYIEIPSVKTMNFGMNDTIVIRCKSESLEDTIKAISSIHRTYKKNILPVLPIYPNTGSWFGYDQIDKNTKTTASVAFARCLKSAIDKEISKIVSENPTINGADNEILFMKDVIKSNILNNKDIIDNIVNTVKSECKFYGLKEDDCLTYSNVMSELDKMVSPSKVSVISKIKDYFSKDLIQPAIDFGPVEEKKNENQAPEIPKVSSPIDDTLIGASIDFGEEDTKSKSDIFFESESNEKIVEPSITADNMIQEMINVRGNLSTNDEQVEEQAPSLSIPEEQISVPVDVKIDDNIPSMEDEEVNVPSPNPDELSEYLSEEIPNEEIKAENINDMGMSLNKLENSISSITSEIQAEVDSEQNSLDETIDFKIDMDDELSEEEVNSIVSDGLDKNYNKYIGLVSDVNILDNVIPSLGNITLYEYFEHENLTEKIGVNDEVITHGGQILPAKDFIESKIISHVLGTDLQSDRNFLEAYNNHDTYNYLFNLYASEQRKKKETNGEIEEDNKKGIFGGLFHR